MCFNWVENTFHNNLILDTKCIDMLWKVKLLEVIGIHEKFDNLCRVFSYCIKRLSSKQRIFNIAFSSCCWLMEVSMHRRNFFDVANTIISQTQCITNLYLKCSNLGLLSRNLKYNFNEKPNFWIKYWLAMEISTVMMILEVFYTTYDNWVIRFTDIL